MWRQTASYQQRKKFYKYDFRNLYLHKVLFLYIMEDFKIIYILKIS